MTSQRVWIFVIVFSSVCLFVGQTHAAEPPSIATALALVPKQKDVEYETPKEADFSKCKIDIEKKGTSVAVVVMGPSGQILRKYVNTDGDPKFYEQWCFYHLGVEVYRDIDTNKNGVPDQHRWLNRGGSRWGIDKNEDGRIDQWRILTAAESAREAVRAMIAHDVGALQAVMISADDLKTLGVHPQLEAKLMDSVSDLEKKAKEVMKKSKIFSPLYAWTRFDAQIPNLIPADEEKAKEDLQVYESAFANLDLVKRDPAKMTETVQIGEMIRVGEVWKLTQIPQPIEGEKTSISPVLMEPLLSTPAVAANSPAASPKVQKILAELDDIGQKVMQPGQNEKQVKAQMIKHASLFKEAIELATNNDEKVLLMKQNIDLLGIAAQAGTYPDGAKELRAIEADFQKKAPNSPLLPYAVYRRIQAEYSVNLEQFRDNKDKQEETQKTWLQSLEDFMAKFPSAEDSDDVLMTLANQDEYQGRNKEAIVWYQRLVKEAPKSKLLPRAQGALRRLNLDGQVLALEGPLLSGGTLNVKDLKGKVYVVVFWNSAFEACEVDIPQLRLLYRDYQAKGFEIVGVALETDKTIALDYAKKHEMNWKQIFQPGSQSQLGGIDSPIAVNFGIISFPTMFLVNSEGKVLSRSASITDVKTELSNLVKQKNK